jgi:hypothetical protein
VSSQRKELIFPRSTLQSNRLLQLLTIDFSKLSETIQVGLLSPALHVTLLDTHHALSKRREKNQKIKKIEKIKKKKLKKSNYKKNRLKF